MKGVNSVPRRSANGCRVEAVGSASGSLVGEITGAGMSISDTQCSVSSPAPKSEPGKPSAGPRGSPSGR